MNKWQKYLLIFIFTIFIFLFTSSYLSKEVHLYVCDCVDQNLFWHDYAILLKTNVSEFFRNLFHDIYNYNRNPFSIVPLLPFAFIFNDFRLGFIFAVELIYMIPVMIIIWHVINKHFLNNKEIKCKELLMFFSSIFLWTTLWYPVISGLPDIIGMIPILICFLIYLKYKFNQKISMKILILFSILLYSAFLARRWYSVVIFSFCMSIVIENIIIALKSNEKLKQIGNTFLNLGIVTAIFLILANIIQGGYVRNIIQNELAERSIYTVNINQFYVIYEHLGLLTCIFAIMGVIFYLKNKLIRFTTLNLCIYIFMYMIVMNNQLLWINHFIYIAVCVCVLFCAGIFKIYECIRNEKIKKIYIALIVLFNIVNFYTFFIMERPKNVNILTARTTAYPKQIKDYDRIKELYQYLENEYNKNQNIKVAIYGLNENLGYWQFRSLNPDSEFAKNAMGYEKIINDDFINADYNEDYVILFNPIGIFAPDEVSTKIKETAKMFEENYGIAKNYEKIREFELQDEKNTKVILYKKK